MTSTAASLAAETGRASKAIFPSWTRRVPSPKPTGRYPLALEAVGSSMISAHVFTAITNTTRQARYFSFLSWIFWTFDRYRDKQVLPSKRPLAQKRWRIRLEHALRCCTQCYALETTGAPARGLIGVQKTPDLRNERGSAPVELRGKFVEKIASAFEAQFYGSPFAALGLAVPKDGCMRLYRLGREAGEAFDETIRSGTSASGRATLDALLDVRHEITVRELLRLAEVLRIRSLAPGEPEHEVLMRVLFRQDPADQELGELAVDDRCRAIALARVLDVVGQSKDTIERPSDCHRVFACGTFDDGRPLETGPAFIRTNAVWQRYEERQHQKIAVSAFWQETLEFLENEHAPPQPASAIVEHCLSLLERSETLPEWFGANALDLTVDLATAAICDRVARAGEDPMTVGFELTEMIRDLKDEGGGPARLGRALASLLLTVGTWRDSRPDLDSSLVALQERGGAARLALPWIADELRRRGQQTLQELVQWLVEWCVLGQAIRVAYEKSGTRGGVNRFFVERVDGGYRIVQEHPLLGRMPYDADRLEGAFSLMTTLGLLRKRAADSPYALTSAGRRQLQLVVRRALSTEVA